MFGKIIAAVKNDFVQTGKDFASVWHGFTGFFGDVEADVAADVSKGVADVKGAVTAVDNSVKADVSTVKADVKADVTGVEAKLADVFGDVPVPAKPAVSQLKPASVAWDVTH